jgi:hypothetical protein
MNYQNRTLTSRERNWLRIMTSGLLAGITSSAAWGTIVNSPGFPVVTDPDLGQHALEWNYAIAASAVGTSAKSDSLVTYPGPDSTFVSSITQATHASFPLTITQNDTSDVSIDGSVGAGQLHGVAAASTDNGPATASASVTVDFIDNIAITKTGIPKFTFKIDGSVSPDGTNEHNIPGDTVTGGALAQLLVFPDDGNPLPTTGQLMDVTYYESHQIGFDTRTDTVPSSFNTVFQAGTHWWVAARLQVGAGARIVAEDMVHEGSTTDFGDTVTLNIDADPSTPDFAYTTDSGVNYTTSATTPVPEPACITLFAAAGGIMVLRRRTR